MTSLDSDTALRDRIRELGDRAELRELSDRYLIDFDRRRGDDSWFGSVFTEDVWVKFPLGEYTGFAGLAEFAREGRSRFERTHHLSANVGIVLEGDRARVRAHVLATHVHRADEPSRHFGVGGHYDAEAVRLPQGWRFRRLEFFPVWVGGTAEPPEAFHRS